MNNNYVRRSISTFYQENVIGPLLVNFMLNGLEDLIKLNCKKSMINFSCTQFKDKGYFADSIKQVSISVLVN
jgi:hypothetical protein